MNFMVDMKMLRFFLQYLKNKVRDEAYFIHADKHQSFFQVGLKRRNISCKAKAKE